MSCALDARFGMHALQDFLLIAIKKYDLTQVQKEEWSQVVCMIEKGNDFESSLNPVTEHNLLKILITETGHFLSALDKEYSLKIMSGEIEWPATQLLKKIVNTLPEGDRTLHALTSNYDLLFEYACSHAEISYSNGFFGEIFRKKDWQSIERALLREEKVYHAKKMQIRYKIKKHVRIYKVHGSLNYFFYRGEVVENNAWLWSPPDFAERVIITPGLSKYQALQRYRQELLQDADGAIENSTHFLFLGYGFNDSHLEEYIRRKLISQSCHGLIITRSANQKIKTLLENSENLWLICKEESQASNSTLILNKKYPEGLILKEQNLWDIREFTQTIFGG